MRRRDLLVRSSTLVGFLAVGASAWSFSRPWRLPKAKQQSDWDKGVVAHIIPTASDTALRLTISLSHARQSVSLWIAGKDYSGIQCDRDGKHWQFEAKGLPAATTHSLTLIDQGGLRLCDPWPLATLPSFDTETPSLKMLVYTCAGGSDLFWTPVTGGLFQPSEVRSRLIARGLSFEPDVVIANGDHIYWDLDGKYGLVQGNSLTARLGAGWFERRSPLTSAHNEAVIKKGCGPQIAGIYGNMMRSTPCWFLADDHDYFENDDWTNGKGTFPPDPFHLAAAQAVQALYYPKPITPEDQPDGTANLRFGDLVEALFYDCRKNATLAGPNGVLVAPEGEAWLLDRMKTSDATHIVNVPGLPIIWSAGKWMEWYPDTADNKPKDGWSSGWLAQHNRLLAASTARSDKLPLWLNGDLHCSAAGQVEAIGGTVLPQPAAAILCGTIGTASLGFPSNARGAKARPAANLGTNEWVSPQEKNGFAIVEFSKTKVDIALFNWEPSDGLEAIDSLQPFWQRSFSVPS